MVPLKEERKKSRSEEVKSIQESVKPENVRPHWRGRLLPRRRGGTEKSRGLCEPRQKSKDRLKIGRAWVGISEKSSFSWHLSSKSTSLPTILPRKPYVPVERCPPPSTPGKYDRFYPPPRSFPVRFLRRPRVRHYHQYLSGGCATFYKVRDFPAPVRTCILRASPTGSLFYHFRPPLHSIGLNHCFPPSSYSRRSIETASHSNCSYTLSLSLFLHG